VCTVLGGVRPNRHASLQMWFVLLGLGATPWPTQIVPRGVTLRAYKTASLRVQPQPKAFLAEDSRCAVRPGSDCKWVLPDGKCSPACHIVDCDFISCDSLERPPCPQNVQEAFVTTAVQLQPDKNPDCVGLARRELVAAGKARDVLMELITTNLAACGSCDSEAEVRTVLDPWTKLEDMPSAWRSTRRWLGERMRALRKKAVQYSPWLTLAGAIAIQALAVMGLV